MTNLHEEFPDLAQSTINAVMGAVNDNVEETRQMLRGMAEEGKRDTEKQNERKISELQAQFTTIPKDVILRILKENKYDVDACIVPLFNVLAEAQTQEQVVSKKHREEEEKKRAKEQTKVQIKQLMEIFQTIPKDTIQKILDDNEGDIQETTTHLLAVVSQQEESKKHEQTNKQKERERLSKEQEERMKRVKVEALREKFPELLPKDIMTALELTKWDIKEACKKLVSLSAEKKKKELKSLFQSFSDEDIQDALQANDWNVPATAKVLSSRREAKKVVVPPQETKKEDKKKEEPSPIVITKVPQTLLEKSMILGNQVEAEITKTEEEKRQLATKERNEEFKKQLEEVIKNQVQNGNNGMPGLVPPLLPKQIDALNNKKPFEDEQPEQAILPLKESPIKIPTSENVVSPTTSTIGGLIVTLSVSPIHVDTGNTITVDWEVISGNSSAYDWIGMFAVDQPNKQYITYEWRGKEEKKGKLTFVAPNTYGAYGFRYFPSKSYEHVAISERVIVGPQIELLASLDKESKKAKVSWAQKSGNHYRRAWCGLYEQSQTNNKQFIAWDYAPKPNTEIVFDAPVKPAIYEFRFFSYDYIDVARSNPIVIEGQDKMSVTIADRIITVKKNIVTVNPATDSVWIGVFLSNQTDNKQWRRYKYVHDRISDETFKCPNTPANYEVRLFANKNIDCIIKSTSFDIPEDKK